MDLCQVCIHTNLKSFKLTPISTDETSLDIYLTNNAVYPPVNKKLASDISTSEGSYTVNVGDITSGYGKLDLGIPLDLTV